MLTMGLDRFPSFLGQSNLILIIIVVMRGSISVKVSWCWIPMRELTAALAY